MKECTFLGDNIPPQPMPCARRQCGNVLRPNDTVWRDDSSPRTDLYCSPACFGHSFPSDEAFRAWQRIHAAKVVAHPTDAASDTW